MIFLVTDKFVSPHDANALIRAQNPNVVRRINRFARATFKTRGGRLGSGMGLLLEGLWGYHMSAALEANGMEVCWIADNMYNDYAIAHLDITWDPATKAGELLRIEAKSMNLGADESKGHFAEIAQNIGPEDLLLVLVWRWTPDNTNFRVWPKVEDVFLGSARAIADLRDQLHIARGGTFVERTNCPDGCAFSECRHDGEPLNANGKRERPQGPINTKPASVSFAANFGGLVRMIGTGNTAAAALRTRVRHANPVADDYVKFIGRNRMRDY